MRIQTDVIGRKLGKYEIIDRIGRGGMAEVYRGYHAALDRYVAIKLLHSFLADDPEFKTRFEREARSVARLKHPNIVQVYDFEYDQDSDTYYMVMEFINGPTLKDSLFDLAAAGSRLPIPETVHIIKTAARALAYAHDRKMIHRDVKPANLMLDVDGRVVLTDFGIAKIVTGAHITTSGGIVGTPAYMSPEQGLGQAGDERSDLYSLGVILYQLVTGRLPFDANTPLAIILKHVNEPLPLPSQFVPELPTDLETAIRRALQKDPNTRYQSAHEFAAALDALQMASYARPVAASRQGPAGSASPQGAGDGDTPILPPADLPDASPGPSARPRRRYAGVLSTAAFVLALIVAGLVAFGRDRVASAPTTPGSEPQSLASTATIIATAVAQNPTITLTPTRRLSPTPAPTATPNRTPTPVLTGTIVASATHTATSDLTLTAAFLALQRETAATPTPDMPGTLAACDLEYIVVLPDKHNRPPSPTDFNSPRLIRANSDFEFEIVLRNTGTCVWPENTRLTYSAALTENPDPSVDLTPLRETCPEYLRPGLNFARQQQSNFFIKQSVGITGDSPPLLFTGTAPRAFGCYYGVWELIYPNSNTRIGRPLVLTIRAWGS